MPFLHFATPPSRDSVRVQQNERFQGQRAPPHQPEAAAEHPHAVADTEKDSIAIHSNATVGQGQGSSIEPLTFEKRAVARQPPSPEQPKAAASHAAFQRAITGPPALPNHTPGESPLVRESKSLLTDALTSNKPSRPGLSAGVSGGILRNCVNDLVVVPTNDACAEIAEHEDAKEQKQTRTPAVTPLRAHFAADPERPRRQQSSSPPKTSTARSPTPQVGKPDQMPPRWRTSSAVAGETSGHQDPLPLTEARVASLETEAPVLTRRRCLVFQESTDVLERAAERAARLARGQADRGDGTPNNGAAPSVKAEPARRRGSQQSASSAGEESCSTRSSWIARGSSPPSSLVTSPMASLATGKRSDNDRSDDSGKGEDDTPVGASASTSFTVRSTAVESLARRNPTPSPAIDASGTEKGPRLKFAQSPRELRSFRTARREVEAFPSRFTRRPPGSGTPPTPNDNSTQEVTIAGQGHPRSTKRALSFTICPPPDRKGERSSILRGKVPGSPAPNALSYKQRVRGMRGGAPMLSPAPYTAGNPDLRASSAASRSSGSASGYNEDEENDSDEDGSEESDSDVGSADSELEAGSSDDDSEVVEEDEELSEGSQAKSLDDRCSPANVGRPREATGSLESSISKSLRSGGERRRRTSEQYDTGAQRHRSDVKRADALKRVESPPQSTQVGTQQTAALGDRARSPPALGPALVPKDSRNFSHPICFLPDTFEDSAPASPIASTDIETTTNEGLGGASNNVWTSDVASDPNSRRCSWQQAAVPISTSVSTALSLPFYRSRDRPSASGPTSDAEQQGGQPGWRAPSWLQSHYYSQSQTHRGRQAGAPIAMAEGDGTDDFVGPPSLGLTFDGMPSRPMHMRNSSSKAAEEYQRAWSHVQRRNSSAVSSPALGPRTTSPSGLPHPASVAFLNSGALSPRSPSARPGSTQRTPSAASHNRGRPSLAQCSLAAVVGATSPPRDTALDHLKHYFDHAPSAVGDASRASEVTTPASGMQSPVGGGAGAAAVRYWNETLSALAQAMKGETNSSDPGLHKDGCRSNSFGLVRHERTRSAPLDAMMDSALDPVWSAPSQELQSSRTETAPNTDSRQAATSSIPRPIRIHSPSSAWNSDRDGEAPSRHASRPRRHSKLRKQTRAAKSQGASPPPLEYMRRETGPDGHTRVILLESEGRGHDRADAEERRTRRRRKRKTEVSMEFNWGRCKITDKRDGPALD